jgi:hypothetical protein
MAPIDNGDNRRGASALGSPASQIANPSRVVVLEDDAILSVVCRNGTARKADPFPIRQAAASIRRIVRATPSANPQPGARRSRPQTTHAEIARLIS